MVPLREPVVVPAQLCQLRGQEGTEVREDCRVCQASLGHRCPGWGRSSWQGVLWEVTGAGRRQVRWPGSERVRGETLNILMTSYRETVLHTSPEGTRRSRRKPTQ